MFSVRRATGWERWKCCWKTDPFFWESDKSTPNLTFFNVNDPSVILPLKSIAYGLSNTTSRLMGNYLNDGMNSALVNPSTQNESIEDLLRL